MQKYIVKTSTQNFGAEDFKAANEIANKLAKDGVKFGIWNVLDNDWCDDQRPDPAPKAPAAAPRKATQRHYCASCKRGDIKAEADVYVSGRIRISGGSMIPYRAYLCNEHLELLGETENADHLRIRKL